MSEPRVRPGWGSGAAFAALACAVVAAVVVGLPGLASLVFSEEGAGWAVVPVVALPLAGLEVVAAVSLSRGRPGPMVVWVPVAVVAVLVATAVTEPELAGEGLAGQLWFVGLASVLPVVAAVAGARARSARIARRTPQTGS